MDTSDNLTVIKSTAKIQKTFDIRKLLSKKMQVNRTFSIIPYGIQLRLE